MAGNYLFSKLCVLTHKVRAWHPLTRILRGKHMLPAWMPQRPPLSSGDIDTLLPVTRSCPILPQVLKTGITSIHPPSTLLIHGVSDCFHVLHTHFLVKLVVRLRIFCSPLQLSFQTCRFESCQPCLNAPTAHKTRSKSWPRLSTMGPMYPSRLSCLAWPRTLVLKTNLPLAFSTKRKKISLPLDPLHSTTHLLGLLNVSCFVTTSWNFQTGSCYSFVHNMRT